MENLIEKSRETERLLTVAFQRSDRRMLLFLLLFLVVIAAAFAPLLHDNLPFFRPRTARTIAKPERPAPADIAVPPAPTPDLVPEDIRNGEPLPEPPAVEPTPPDDLPRAFDLLDRPEL
jgi:hypothetical protein